MSVLRVPPDVRSPHPQAIRLRSDWRPRAREAWPSRYCQLWLLAAPFAGLVLAETVFDLGPAGRWELWKAALLGTLLMTPFAVGAYFGLRSGLKGYRGGWAGKGAGLRLWKVATGEPVGDFQPLASGTGNPRGLFIDHCAGVVIGETADLKRAASTCIGSPASVSRLVTGRTGSPRASRHGFPVATNSRRQAFNELRWGLPLPPFIAAATSTTNRLRSAKILRTPPRSNTAATARAFRATRTAIISRVSLWSCPAAIVLSFLPPRSARFASTQTLRRMPPRSSGWSALR